MSKHAISRVGKSQNENAPQILKNDIRRAAGQSFFNLITAVDGHPGEELLGDMTSRQGWRRLAALAKAGKVTGDDLADFMMVSHVRVMPEHETGLDAQKVLDRMVARNMKGKIGKQMIAGFVNALSNNNLLPQFTENVKMLSGESGQPESEVKVTPDKLAEEAMEFLQDSVGYDVIEDRVIDISLEEVLNCLEQALDFESDNEELLMRNPFLPHIYHIFDASRHIQIREDKKYRIVRLYVIALGKASGNVSNTYLKSVSEESRSVFKYFIYDDVSDEDWNKIRDGIIKLNTSYLNYTFSNFSNSESLNLLDV